MSKKYRFKGVVENGVIKHYDTFTIGKIYELREGKQLTDLYAFINDKGNDDGFSIDENKWFEEVKEETKSELIWPFAQAMVLVFIIS